MGLFRLNNSSFLCAILEKEYTTANLLTCISNTGQSNFTLIRIMVCQNILDH